MWATNPSRPIRHRSRRPKPNRSRGVRLRPKKSVPESGADFFMAGDEPAMECHGYYGLFRAGSRQTPAAGVKGSGSAGCHTPSVSAIRSWPAAIRSYEKTGGCLFRPPLFLYRVQPGAESTLSRFRLSYCSGLLATPTPYGTNPLSRLRPPISVIRISPV